MEFREMIYTRPGPFSLLSLAIRNAWLDVAILLLQHGFNPNKYQLHDILEAIKGSIGTIGSSGKKLLQCFLAAGYRIKAQDEQELLRLASPTNVVLNEACISWILDQAGVNQPHGLASLCRAAIRTRLRVCRAQASVIPAIERLGLPVTLQRYLSLAEFGEDPQAGGDTWPYGGSSAYCSHANMMASLFAMPRRPKIEQQRYIREFWKASCLCSK